MPSFAMTVPYLRTSPLHIPRRDLVLAAADSLWLRVIVVDSDRPCAQALDITPGIGGPSVQFLVWPDIQPRYGYGNWHDYGWGYPCSAAGQVLFNGTGVPGDARGSFDFSLPSGTMASWPRRNRWCVQLNYDMQGADVLLTGRIHVQMFGLAFSFAPPLLETDDYIPVHTDIDEQVLA